MIKPFIATPCYESIKPQYAASLAHTLYMLGAHGRGASYELSILHHYDTPTARNIQVSRFLASDCTHLFFIDSDIGWRAENFRRLLISGHDVCCGVYRKKVDPAKPQEWAFSALPGSDERIAQHPETGFYEIDGCGTGFMCISRAALETVIAMCPERKVNIAGGVDEHSCWLFAVEPRNGDLITEDLIFCDLWRKAGGKIWADPECSLDHVGDHTWRGGLSDLIVPVFGRAA